MDPIAGHRDDYIDTTRSVSARYIPSDFASIVDSKSGWTNEQVVFKIASIRLNPNSRCINLSRDKPRDFRGICKKIIRRSLLDRRDEIEGLNMNSIISLWYRNQQVGFQIKIKPLIQRQFVRFAKHIAIGKVCAGEWQAGQGVLCSKLMNRHTSKNNGRIRRIVYSRKSQVKLWVRRGEKSTLIRFVFDFVSIRCVENSTAASQNIRSVCIG